MYISLIKFLHYGLGCHHDCIKFFLITLDFSVLDWYMDLILTLFLWLPESSLSGRGDEPGASSCWTSYL